MEAITISEYRLEWQDEFELLASMIRDIVGERVIRIDHIGSTAIPFDRLAGSLNLPRLTL